jgi:hypothetical protein
VRWWLLGIEKVEALVEGVGSGKLGVGGLSMFTSGRGERVTEACSALGTLAQAAGGNPSNGWWGASKLVESAGVSTKDKVDTVSCDSATIAAIEGSAETMAENGRRSEGCDRKGGPLLWSSERDRRGGPFRCSPEEGMALVIFLANVWPVVPAT